MKLTDAQRMILYCFGMVLWGLFVMSMLYIGVLIFENGG